MTAAARETPVTVTGDELVALAALLDYPRGDLTAAVERCRALLARRDRSAAEDLGALERAAAAPAALEELYTRTFDLDPVVTLEVGWHLYGEQYERGRFLARCRELLAAAGVDERGELPDHLASLLRALPRLPRADAARLAAKHLRPAVEKIHSGLGGAEGATDNPYRPVLAAVHGAVTALAAEDTP